jgi:hypothetical protein
MSYNEAETRAYLVDPAIHRRGWTEELVRLEETAGAIEVVTGNARRRSRGRVDYTLRIKGISSSRASSRVSIPSMSRSMRKLRRVFRRGPVALAARFSIVPRRHGNEAGDRTAVDFQDRAFGVRRQ